MTAARFFFLLLCFNQLLSGESETWALLSNNKSQEIWSAAFGRLPPGIEKKKKRLTSGSLEARNTSYISYICITPFRFFFLNPPEAVNQVLIREMETYKDEFSTWGVGRALVGGSSNEIRRGGGATAGLSLPSQNPVWTSWPSADLQRWLWDGWWTGSAACPTASK